MARIVTTSAWLFGLVNAALKQFGFSEAVFEITQKIHRSGTYSSDVEEVMFGDSPFFVPGTTIILVHLAAWPTVLLRLQSQGEQDSGLKAQGSKTFFVVCMWCYAPFLVCKGCP